MIPIIVKGNTATIDVNPDAPVVTYLDKWYSHGYLASLGLLENKKYAVRQVTYNLKRVGLARVQEIANKFDTGAFTCPVCQRKAAATKASQDRRPPAPPAQVPTVTEQPDLSFPEFDDVFNDTKEADRDSAVDTLTTMLDKLTLFSALR